MKKEDGWWLLCMKKKKQSKQSRKKNDILMKFSVKSRKEPKLGVRGGFVAHCVRQLLLLILLLNH